MVDGGLLRACPCDSPSELPDAGASRCSCPALYLAWPSHASEMRGPAPCSCNVPWSRRRRSDEREEKVLVVEEIPHLRVALIHSALPSCIHSRSDFIESFYISPWHPSIERTRVFTDSVHTAPKE